MLASIRLKFFILASLTLGLIALGGFVRATGAGLSCPDWPLCYGRVVPHTIADGIAQEVGHRYFASGITLFTIWISVIAYRQRAEFPRFWKVSNFLIFLLVVQIVFGGLTVLMKLNPFIVTGHLLLGTLFFQTVALLSLTRPQNSMYEVTTKYSKGQELTISMLLIFVFVQIILGGFVGSSGASLACPDIPLCFGQLLPANATGQQSFQMLHRGLGFLIFFTSLYLVVSAARSKNSALPLTRSLALFGLVLAQIIIGFANVYFRIPAAITVFHLVVAQLILLTVASLHRHLRNKVEFFFSSDV
jgi:heme A synthase